MAINNETYQIIREVEKTGWGTPVKVELSIHVEKEESLSNFPISDKVKSLFKRIRKEVQDIDYEALWGYREFKQGGKMKEVKTTDEDLFAGFSGDWNDISAESLRESRTFTRTVDVW